MLTVSDTRPRYGRRAFLRIGTLSLGGLSLPGLLATQAAEQKRLLSGRSVIFLFLHGGPSQFETFDPKMSAPADIRCATGEIATRMPGVTFGAALPRLASMADRLAVVRSFTPATPIMTSSQSSAATRTGANLGSLYARIAGSEPIRRRACRPTRCCFLAPSIATAGPAQTFGRFEATGRSAPAMPPSCPAAGATCNRTCN